MKKRQDPLGKESANGGRLLRRLLGRANLFHTPPPVPANRQISCANRRRRLFSSFSLMSQPHLRMISLPLVTRPPFGAGGGAVPAPRQRASAPSLLVRAAPTGGSCTSLSSGLAGPARSREPRSHRAPGPPGRHRPESVPKMKGGAGPAPWPHDAAFAGGGDGRPGNSRAGHNHTGSTA